MSNIKCQISNRKNIKPNYWKFGIGNLTLDIPAAQAGFTIIELAVIIGVTGILASIVGTSYFQTQHNVDMHGAVNVLVSDIRQQQLKSMTGDTSGTGIVTSYGIYFQSNKYTLFRGASYSSADINNFAVNLSQNLQFINDTFPTTSLVFENGTGKFTGYSSITNTIQVKDTVTNQVVTIGVNRYGVVIQAN